MTPSGEVEQLAAALVAVGAQGRAHALDDRAQAGQPGPRLHVGDGRRARRRADSGGAPAPGPVSGEIDRPTHASTVVSFASPERPHRPRGVTWSVGSRLRTA